MGIDEKKKLIFFNILFLIKRNGKDKTPNECGRCLAGFKRLEMGYSSIQHA